MNADPLPRHAMRALLRRLRPPDLPVFHAYRSDVELARFQGWVPMSLGAAESFLKAMEVVPLFQPGAWAQIAIADPSSDHLFGDVGLWLAEGGRGAEIGFTLSRSAQGKGYATAAVVGAIEMLFEHTQVAEVLGVTDMRNLASVAVLERVGMKPVESREVEFKGERCTERVYVRKR